MKGGREGRVHRVRVHRVRSPVKGGRRALVRRVAVGLSEMGSRSIVHVRPCKYSDPSGIGNKEK